jgi:hypothetical protein
MAQREAQTTVVFRRLAVERHDLKRSHEGPRCRASYTRL